MAILLNEFLETFSENSDHGTALNNLGQTQGMNQNLIPM